MKWCLACTAWLGTVICRHITIPTLWHGGDVKSWECKEEKDAGAIKSPAKGRISTFVCAVIMCGMGKQLPGKLISCPTRSAMCPHSVSWDVSRRHHIHFLRKQTKYILRLSKEPILVHCPANKYSVSLFNFLKNVANEM